MNPDPTRVTPATTSRRPGEDPAGLVIDRLGEDADGIARDPSGAILYVEGALPGETVRASPAGNRYAVREILVASPDRVVPVCRHAPVCGGCSLQHLAPGAALAWKVDRVTAALAAPDGAAGPAASVSQTSPRTRRRMDLAFARDDTSAVLVGLHPRGGSAVVDLAECHVLDPSLFRLLAPLRVLLRSMEAAGSRGSIVANLLDDGADLLLRTDRLPGTADRARVAAFAQANAVPRVSWQAERQAARTVPETLASLTPARLRLGSATVHPGAGAFLQATVDGEARIVAAVVAGLAGIGPRAKIVELYAGIGTLTFPIATAGRVTAYEGDANAVAALGRAAGGTRVEAVRRDLARAPVSARELKDADAIVLDPPYGSTPGQIAEIAASLVPRVVLVSCNPAALRRDAATLRASGYAVTAVTVIDQFLWSARIESVVVFDRRPARKRR